MTTIQGLAALIVILTTFRGLSSARRSNSADQATKGNGLSEAQTKKILNTICPIGCLACAVEIWQGARILLGIAKSNAVATLNDIYHVGIIAIAVAVSFSMFFVFMIFLLLVHKFEFK